MENARNSLQAALGDVTVVEETSGVFAEVALGREYITLGAENAVAELYTRRIRLL